MTYDERLVREVVRLSDGGTDNDFSTGGGDRSGLAYGSSRGKQESRYGPHHNAPRGPDIRVSPLVVGRIYYPR